MKGGSEGVGIKSALREVFRGRIGARSYAWMRALAQGCCSAHERKERVRPFSACVPHKPNAEPRPTPAGPALVTRLRGVKRRQSWRLCAGKDGNKEKRLGVPGCTQVSRNDADDDKPSGGIAPLQHG